MHADGYEHLLLDPIGPVLRVTLNRPKRRNALSTELLAELGDVVTTAGADREISVVVLRGAGPDFCSGYDLTPTDRQRGRDGTSLVETVHAARREIGIYELLWRCPIPTIAQIHGHCLAAGTDLALCCDLLVCARDAAIGYPAVRCMGTPATHMWLYHLGPQWTKRLLLTGDSITGAKAAQLGLAVDAVDPDALDRHVLDLATRISWVPRDLLIATKDVVNHGLDLMGRALLQQTAATQMALAQHTPRAGAFWATAAERGVKQAIAERDSRFAAADPIS